MKNIGCHLNIITILNDNVNKFGKLYQIQIEMPLAEGSLESYLKKNPMLKEEQIVAILRQLFAGLKFAHDKNITHMDLKPGNVLIFSGVYKIADWGCSLQLKSYQSTSLKSKLAGTWGYNAPELESKYDK